MKGTFLSAVSRTTELIQYIFIMKKNHGNNDTEVYHKNKSAIYPGD